jgi:hypothetical protein
MRLIVRRRIGVGAGAAIAGIVLGWLCWPGHEHLHAPGAMNTGHAELACAACHRPAPGTLRQQLQNVARAWLGRDAAPVDIGYRAVGNEDCLACHERPDDRHPVFRFLEPRFADARARLHPERCTACHREHAGVRVTLADGSYCRSCHVDVALDRDPLDVSHRDLVTHDQWDTCLGCHDYHGNHAIELPHQLARATPPDVIRAYFAGGASPYPPPLRPAQPPEVQPR